MRDAFRLIKQLFEAMGVGYEYARHLKGWLEEVGMESVEERMLDVPLGAANPEREMAAKGVRSYALATKGLVAAAKGKLVLGFLRFLVVLRLCLLRKSRNDDRFGL